MILRVGGFFSGIGSHVSACDRLESEYVHFEHIFQCEINSKVAEVFDQLHANHGHIRNLGDVSAVDNIGGELRVDLLFWTPPCQDIAVCNSHRMGNSHGSGTRSSLAFEVPRIIANTPKRERPKYLIMEEVPTMIGKYRDNFLELLESLSELGYYHAYRTIEATEVGVAQTRRRAYCISSLVEPPAFPDKVPLNKCLGDYLEDDVPEKYYLSSDRVANLILSNRKEMDAGRGFRCVPQDGSVVAHTLTGKCGGGSKTENFILTDPSSIRNWLETGNKCIVDRCIQVGTLSGKGFDCIKRVYSPAGCCPTIPTGAGGGHLPKFVESDELPSIRIRKITPREALRLMGYVDEEIDRLNGFSDAMLYRCAGNSVVVDCFAALTSQIVKQIREDD